MTLKEWCIEKDYHYEEIGQWSYTTGRVRGMRVFASRVAGRIEICVADEEFEEVTDTIAAIMLMPEYDGLKPFVIKCDGVSSTEEVANE